MRNVARETQSSVLCSIATCLPRCPSDCLQMLADVGRHVMPILQEIQDSSGRCKLDQRARFPRSPRARARPLLPLRTCLVIRCSPRPSMIPDATSRHSENAACQVIVPGVAQACEVGSARGMSNGRVTCWVSPWVYFMSSCSQARERCPRPDEPLLQN